MNDYNIRDFNSVSISGEIALPEGFPKSYTIENKIKYLTKVREVFDPGEVKGFEHAIRTSHEFMPRFSFNGGERHFFVADTIDHFNVQFKNGKVQINSITSSKFNNQSLAVKKILIIAMERLAKELNWENTTHKISCNAIDYHVSKGAKESLNWHTDMWSIPSEYSFFTLLSNPIDSETGWNGGDLLYTEARDFKLREIEYEERKKIYDLDEKTHGEMSNEPNSPVWKIQYAQNEGILFGNRGMRHKITAIDPLNDKARRLILAIFDFGEVS